MDSSINVVTLNPDLEENISFPKREPRELALQDIFSGMKQWRIWLLLAYQDIRVRYRRSILGPFWITLSMAITVYSMGFLYAHLFHTNMQEYYPFLVAGMLAWSLISNVIIDLTDTFTLSFGLIKQIKLPYSLYINRVTTRNFIIFFHNILVMLPILLLFHEDAKINFNTFLLIPVLALIYINSISYGLILAVIGARYRDISQIIKSLIQVAFFVTPVMWNPNVLPANYQHLINLNPFYIFVQLLRAPLIGQVPSLLIVAIGLGITLLGIAICMAMFTRYRARIIYWL